MTKNARSIILGSLLAPLLLPAAVFGAQQCRYTDVQAADIDFDQPGKRLQQKARIEIPPGAVVGRIVIKRRKIFDLSETGHGWLYEWGNRLHILTRKSAIRAELTFATGEPFDPADLAETERILRNTAWLLDAWVHPFRVCGNRVDIVVLTRDVWTLQPDLGFARAGGETRTSIGFSDENFLGTGTTVAIKHTSGPERDRTFLEYADPSIMGSHWQGGLVIADASDGATQSIYVARPFYEFGTEWSAFFQYRHDNRIDEFYFRGEEVSAFRRDLTIFRAEGGLSLATANRTDKRLLFGYRYTQQDFSAVPGRTVPAPFPADRTLSYPYIGFGMVENRFVQTMNLSRIQRIEDVREGVRFQTTLGWSGTAFGADADRLVLQTSLLDAIVFNTRNLFEYELSQSGWYNTKTDEIENLIVQAHLRYFLGNEAGNKSWFAGLRIAVGKNLTADRRLPIGGGLGLRGYPYRYQTGDRRVLLRLERRYYTDWHPLNLFRVGAVAFFDVGRAWYHDRDNGPHGGWLRDVGFGLRIASDRFETDTILHIDLAFPLDGGGSINDVQLVVRGEATF